MLRTRLISRPLPLPLRWFRRRNSRGNCVARGGGCRSFTRWCRGRPFYDHNQPSSMFGASHHPHSGIAWQRVDVQNTTCICTLQLVQFYSPCKYQDVKSQVMDIRLNNTDPGCIDQAMTPTSGYISSLADELVSRVEYFESRSRREINA